MAKYTVQIPCGPIWNDEDAKKKCPIICAAHLGEWNGEWKTVVDCRMSICECVMDTEREGSKELLIDVVAGPIWNDEDAKEKCPIVCASYGGEWTGEWKTPEETWGVMSICQCKIRV